MSEGREADTGYLRMKHYDDVLKYSHDLFFVNDITLVKRRKVRYDAMIRDDH